ncbi:DJ-1/PfpI family protein [Gluconobacter wancherniae]|uniref:Peptidase n=1 Tax=Gluconobacter wancherniae NBRC 103581 TaxID=656744 RepID=A0A511AWF0_9PROT|nr:DJ-1/PfpI family protein [Gluconobacter wancherniae]MBF0852684.1 DJ-1/PfpI family protein [Gluconobacter wancherniae]MBS1061972.1 DJ-1/PfpI family protein [Gluconobacter wancherniae]MBS1087571.1 DJ-1/PfpI family protein [Gluconobacter wancherniae]GBD56604.1 peptidase [Gluconobacter wancherniae NBRC 103581]GBR64190.1 peptidase C56 [Gluconobacter wancherniae NBRC 103581]
MAAKKILMIVGDFVEDYEVMVPFQMLLMVGHKIDAVSPGKKAGQQIATAIHDFEGHQTYTEKRGHNFTLNASYEGVKADDYDAIIIPGGRAPEQLGTDESVLALVRAFVEQGKPVAAVCHGPQLLAAANVIKGRRISAYPACRAEMILAGAEYASIAMDDAITDGQFVTAPAWPAHPAWIAQFLKVLGTRIEA